LIKCVGLPKGQTFWGIGMLAKGDMASNTYPEIFQPLISSEFL